MPLGTNHYTRAYQPVALEREEPFASDEFFGDNSLFRLALDKYMVSNIFNTFHSETDAGLEAAFDAQTKKWKKRAPWLSDYLAERISSAEVQSNALVYGRDAAIEDAMADTGEDLGLFVSEGYKAALLDTIRNIDNAYRIKSERVGAGEAIVGEMSAFLASPTGLAEIAFPAARFKMAATGSRAGKRFWHLADKGTRTQADKMEILRTALHQGTKEAALFALPVYLQATTQAEYLRELGAYESEQDLAFWEKISELGAIGGVRGLASAGIDIGANFLRRGKIAKANRLVAGKSGLFRHTLKEQSGDKISDVDNTYTGEELDFLEKRVQHLKHTAKTTKIDESVDGGEVKLSDAKSKAARKARIAEAKAKKNALIKEADALEAETERLFETIGDGVYAPSKALSQKAVNIIDEFRAQTKQPTSQPRPTAPEPTPRPTQPPRQSAKSRLRGIMRKKGFRYRRPPRLVLKAEDGVGEQLTPAGEAKGPVLVIGGRRYAADEGTMTSYGKDNRPNKVDTVLRELNKEAGDDIVTPEDLFVISDGEVMFRSDLSDEAVSELSEAFESTAPEFRFKDGMNTAAYIRSLLKGGKPRTIADVDKSSLFNNPDPAARRAGFALPDTEKPGGGGYNKAEADKFDKDFSQKGLGVISEKGEPLTNTPFNQAKSLRDRLNAEPETADEEVLLGMGKDLLALEKEVGKDEFARLMNNADYGKANIYLEFAREIEAAKKAIANHGVDDDTLLKVWNFAGKDKVRASNALGWVREIPFRNDYELRVLVRISEGRPFVRGATENAKAAKGDVELSNLKYEDGLEMFEDAKHVTRGGEKTGFVYERVEKLPDAEKRGEGVLEERGEIKYDLTSVDEATGGFSHVKSFNTEKELLDYVRGMFKGGKGEKPDSVSLFADMREIYENINARKASEPEMIDAIEVLYRTHGKEKAIAILTEQVEPKTARLINVTFGDGGSGFYIAGNNAIGKSVRKEGVYITSTRGSYLLRQTTLPRRTIVDDAYERVMRGEAANLEWERWGSKNRAEPVETTSRMPVVAAFQSKESAMRYALDDDNLALFEADDGDIFEGFGLRVVGDLGEEGYGVYNSDGVLLAADKSFNGAMKKANRIARQTGAEGEGVGNHKLLRTCLIGGK